MAVLHLTKENFDETIAEGKCLVDFWAGWCGPCKMVAPIIEELGEKYDENENVKICKVDVDSEGELAARYGIMSIPTIIVFTDGEESAKGVGVQPIEDLEALLDLG